MLPAFGKMRNHIQIVHVACIGSLVALGVVCYVLAPAVGIEDFGASGALLAVGAVLSVSALVVAVVLPRYSPARRPGAALVTRVQATYLTHVLFATLVETAGLYWGVLAMVLGARGFLAGPMVALAVLVGFFPTQHRLESHLSLTEEQFDALAGRATPSGGPA
jgi:hypothetical protein